MRDRYLFLTAILLCLPVIPAAGLETRVGTRGVVAWGPDPALLAGALSLSVGSDPVSIRGEGGVGSADGEIVWQSLLAIGYRLVVPWQLHPVVEIGLGAAGGGKRMSLYPLAALAGEISTEHLTFSLQVRTQARPFPIPFSSVADFPVRPVSLVLGCDLSIPGPYR